MPDIVYGDAGTNRTITSITYGDAGVNRSLIEVWYGDAGTNRLVWPNNTISLTNHSINSMRIGAGALSSTFETLNTGVARGTNVPGGTTSYAPEWMSAGVAANYDVRWTTTSGALTTGVSGAWQNLGTSRLWSLTGPAGVGVLICTGTVEIRDAATLIVLATATITLRSERA